MIPKNIFRAYDIRGRAGDELTVEACRLIGRAFGTILRERYGIPHPTVAVGRDARTHSPEFEHAVIEGLMSTGCHIFAIGQTPSPVNYFTICTRNLDGGIQITASHNPPGDNGLKLQTRHAEAFAGEDIQELRKRIEEEAFLSGTGTTEDLDGSTPYAEFLGRLFADAGKGRIAAVDSGNGVAGPLYTKILREVGCRLHELYTEPDGTFPNHPADPSKAETLRELQKTVKTAHAQIGIAFDGDGDRLGVVDENGEIRSADEILLLLAEDHLQRNPGKPVVFTVSNSSVLETVIRRLAGVPHMCKVGHSFVEHAMRELGALLGGEQSGHFFLGEEYFGFDDALVAALRLLAILRESGVPLSELLARYPKVYQSPERRPHCPDDRKSEVIAKIALHFGRSFPVLTLDGARIDFGDGAWAGIRQSNTAPCISICMEARSPEKLREIEEIVLEHVRGYPEISWD